MTSSFDILIRAKRIALPCIAAAALVAPGAAFAQQPAPYPDLPPADTTAVAEPAQSLPDLPPADPTDVGRPAVPITVPDGVSSSFGTAGRTAPSSTLPDLAPANPTDVVVPETPLPDLPPANPTQVTPETPAVLPDLPPANPTLVAPASQPAGNGGFDFGDAAIGVAVVAGACAFLLAVAAFVVGRRRRLGASHS